MPPVRGSITSTSVFVPCGPYHSPTSSGSSIVAKTRSRGASKMRSTRISRSVGVVTVAVFCSAAILLSLSSGQQRVESVVALLDHRAVVVDPGGKRVAPVGTEPALPGAADLLALDEAGLLQDPEVLLHPGQRD